MMDPGLIYQKDIENFSMRRHWEWFTIYSEILGWRLQGKD
jgi:hypothetical protein